MRPLIRFIVFFPELLTLAKQVMVVRAGDEDTHHFGNVLRYLSGEDGLARALMIGLLAEAGSISLELIRFFDSDTFDVSALTQAIST